MALAQKGQGTRQEGQPWFAVLAAALALRCNQSPGCIDHLNAQPEPHLLLYHVKSQVAPPNLDVYSPTSRYTMSFFPPPDDTLDSVMRCNTQGGSPQRLQECRPQASGCLSPYDSPVLSAGGATVGCLKPGDNTCPPGSVALREYSTAWALQRCVAVTACGNYTGTADRFTVPARSAQGTLLACLTLNPATQMCPAAPGVINTPVDVVQALPDSPSPCGNSTLPCSASRTVQCLEANATCPAGMLQLYQWSIANVPSTLVGCRPARSVCDLTFNGTSANGTNPNAGDYTVRAVNGVTLLGCVQQGAAACPAAFPFPTRNSAGVLTDCNTNGTAIATCPLPGSNPTYTVEAESLNGVVVECLNPLQVSVCRRVCVPLLVRLRCCSVLFKYGICQGLRCGVVPAYQSNTT